MKPFKTMSIIRSSFISYWFKRIAHLRNCVVYTANGKPNSGHEWNKGKTRRRVMNLYKQQQVWYPRCTSILCLQGAPLLAHCRWRRRRMRRWMFDDGDVLFLFGGDSTERSNTGRSGLEERHSVLLQPANNQHTNDPNTYTLNTFTLARKKTLL